MGTLDDQRLGALLDEVASKTPAPGGGAVAPIVGALASALAQMVINYSTGRKKLAAHRTELEAALERLGRARSLLLGLGAEDAEAYAALNELQRLPEDDPRRSAELKGAALAATQVPLSVVAACGDVLRLLETLVPITNRFLSSDLAIAAVLAEAAARAAHWNVRINLPLLEELGIASGVADEAENVLREAGPRRARIEEACAVG